MEVEAFDAGYLAGIIAPVGTTAAVGETIAYIVPKKEQVHELKRALEKHAATGGEPISAEAAQAERRAESPASSATQEHSVSAAFDAAAAERTAQRAATEWMVPSVDQASGEQTVPGVSPEQLQHLLRHRLSAVAPAAANALADPK